MFKANSGQQPPVSMTAAINAVAQARLKVMAVGVANVGMMPRGLSATNAKTLAVMARAIQAARTVTIHN